MDATATATATATERGAGTEGTTLEERFRLLERQFAADEADRACTSLRAEVDRLCGVKHRQGVAAEDRQIRRAGSKLHTFLVRGCEIERRIPRVRRAVGSGEIDLSYVYDDLQPQETPSDVVEAFARAAVPLAKIAEIDARLSGGMGGLSSSNASILWRDYCDEELKKLNTRPLDRWQLVGLQIDAERVGKRYVIAALGITIDGWKIPLGVHVAKSESTGNVSRLLTKIIKRGLPADSGLIVTIDGGKGIRAAVRKHLPNAEIQRCRVHLARNVKEKLPREMRREINRQLWNAWAISDYKAAKAALRQIADNLQGGYPKAAESLRAGLEDSITLQRTKAPKQLKTSLGTTNPIESMFSLTRTFCRNVKRWRDADMVARWYGAAIMEAARTGMDAIKAAEYLPELGGLLSARAERSEGRSHRNKQQRTQRIKGRAKRAARTFRRQRTTAPTPTTPNTPNTPTAPQRPARRPRRTQPTATTPSTRRRSSHTSSSRALPTTRQTRRRTLATHTA